MSLYFICQHTQNILSQFFIIIEKFFFNFSRLIITCLFLVPSFFSLSQIILLECPVYLTHVLSNQFAKWIEKRIRVQKSKLDMRRGSKEISVERGRMNKCKIDHAMCTRKKDNTSLIEKQRVPMGRTLISRM